ncbi:hypothetical protein [Paraburkholderia guartelaensis]|uniref:Uncharacterized protein n=1 Tax=Paraburkholderia guartelaensis TaxID=2546446 RepID=A0ABU9SIM5_9BURK
MRRLIEEVSAGLPDAPGAVRDDRAIALLAMLSGGVTLARAVPDPALSKRIADAVERSAVALTSARRKQGRRYSNVFHR